MDLAGVQAAVSAVNPYYPSYLRWMQEGNIVKAYPKPHISQMAFKLISKVFRRLGGHYVSHGGQAWFELVLEECDSKHLIGSCCTLKGTIASESSPATLGIVLTQIEAQLARVVEAARFLPEANA